MTLRWLLLLSVTFVVQLGIATDLHFFGVHPELMLLLGICAGVVAGPERGAVIGCLAGILADVMLPVTWGISALAITLVAFAAGLAAEAVMDSTKPISVGIVTAASAVGVLLYASLAQLLGQHSLSDPRLWRIVGIVSLWNAVLSLPVLALGRWAEGDQHGTRVRRGI